MLVNNDKSKIDGLLEILSNESRRKIIELLTKKPCYVSEISYTLRMAPKVVLEHLEKLEKAGIVKSYEEGRRRYYYIDKTLNINITLTPHRFSITYHEDKEGDIKNFISEISKIFNELNNFSGTDLLEKMNRIEKSFRALQREIIEKFDRIIDNMIVKLDEILEEDIDKIITYSLIKGVNTPEKIAQIFNIPYEEVISRFNELEKRGFVVREEKNGKIYWKLVWR
uniref:Metalloregulator ArsR/SmtB family transcription factor n=1 Tax=Geoglobus ahangari TaxID=113653 RepID=A0A7C4W2Y5_9EURY